MSSSMSKKKIKLSDQHAPNCDDSSCRGCDIGEIEVKFTSEDGKEKIKLTPVELFQIALEESSKVVEQDIGIVKRLFDLALEGFESLLVKEKENKREEKDKEKEEEEEEKRRKNKGKKRELEEVNTTSNKQTRYQYALCCIAFGIYLPLVEQIKKGVDILKEIIAEDADFYEGWMELGRGMFALTCTERKLKSRGEEEEEEDSDDDSEKEYNSISKNEFNNYTFGMNAFSKGLSILKLKDKTNYVEETIRAVKDLQDYGILINNIKPFDHAKTIFTKSINYLEDAYNNLEPEIINENKLFQGMWGSCLYYISKLKSRETQGTKEVLEVLDLAIEKLLFTNDTESLGKNLFKEILGQAYLFKSTVENDDDQAIKAFDKGVEYLLETYNEDKGNDNLRKQLETLGVLTDNNNNDESEKKDEYRNEDENEDEEGEYRDEDEEGEYRDEDDEDEDE
ncbi:hypothetical protein Glove_209g102 [Diversispora epigaea]|uniref:Uncharacterized protein n=1 Tax=Diversispora epigaea TaxID=1348612 RepID=A0A397ILZ3_9GLOM|nr:hypothetical protein Glove_209g102 [Diversispora epigaea]